MKRLVLLLFCSGCASVPGLHIARSLTDKNLASKPAAVQVTVPRDGATSYAVDLGAGYTHTFSKSDNIQQDLTFGAEYHRNTLASQKQDSTIATLNLDWLIGNVDNKADPVWFPTLGLKFKKDRIKGTESAVPGLSSTLASKRLRVGEVIGLRRPVAFAWQPSAGLEWERITRAANNGARGATLRPWSEVDVDIYPLWSRLHSALALSLTGRAWHDLSQSRALRTGRENQYLRKASLSYFLDEDQHFAVGVDRISGENPSEGQAEQHYTQLSFKVTF